jgi:hypothetical protein
MDAEERRHRGGRDDGSDGRGFTLRLGHDLGSYAAGDPDLVAADLDAARVWNTHWTLGHALDGGL